MAEIVKDEIEQELKIKRNLLRELIDENTLQEF